MRQTDDGFVLSTGKMVVGRKLAIQESPDDAPGAYVIQKSFVGYADETDDLFAESLPDDLTPAERIEIASYAAGLWQQWAAQNPMTSHG